MATNPKSKGRPASDHAGESSLSVAGKLWLSVNDIAFLGEERIALLEQIGTRGSITQAAKALKISYKAAWDAVDAINNLAPAPVVATATGGRGGGGARLTEEGRRLISAYRTIAAEYQRFLTGVNAAMGDQGATLDLLRRLSLRTSARNQFLGRIVAVTARPVDAEVQIEIQGGQRILAGVTNESVELLGLRPGRSVWALIKAVAVDIVAEKDQSSTTARNVLCGTATQINRSDGPSEVVVALAAGITVRGVVNTASLERLGITEQAPVCAVFSPASVIIGVDG